MKKISVVTTLYKSEPYVFEFYERCLKTLKKLKDENGDPLDYEFIFVDDGSPDHSLQKAIELHNKDPKVTIIELSRNFGHHKAIMTGLTHSDGEYTFLIDVDLEEEPELLETFWIELHKEENEDTDVVYGVQQKRKGRWFERWSGALFYKLFNVLSDAKIPANALIARIMNEKYRKALVQFKEKAVWLAGICELAGFKQKGVYCIKKSKGSSSYSFFKKIKLFLNAVFSFSVQPLYFMIFFGIGFSFLSSCYMIFLMIKKIFFSFPILGWTSILCSIYLIGGIIISGLGIIGIYISKIFEETKNRPYTIIKKITSH